MCPLMQQRASGDDGFSSGNEELSVRRGGFVLRVGEARADDSLGGRIRGSGDTPERGPKLGPGSCFPEAGQEPIRGTDGAPPGIDEGVYGVTFNDQRGLGLEEDAHVEA